MGKISFFFEEIPRKKIRQKELKVIMERLIMDEGSVAGEINVILCTDEFLISMNRQYLNHDFYTDIITFNNNNGKTISGELYISMERIRENAEKFGTKGTQEMVRVIFHGLLHLLNYHDQDDEEKAVMRAKEDYYLALYDIN